MTGAWKTQRQLHHQRAYPSMDNIFLKSATLQLSAQLAGRSTAVLTAYVTLERRGLCGSAKFQGLPES